MQFFPDTPEMLFLYLHRQRLLEAEKRRLASRSAVDRPALMSTAAASIRNSLTHAWKFLIKGEKGAFKQPEASTQPR